MLVQQIKGVIFDMDGTITVPYIDFRKLREELNVDTAWDLLGDLQHLNEKERARHLNVIQKYEQEAIDNIVFQDGVRNAILDLKNKNVKLGIITRNSLTSTKQVLAKLAIEFDIILTREFPHVKPDPEPIYHILREWRLDKNSVIIIGDNRHDILCGLNAGIKTCLFHNTGHLKDPICQKADYCIESYAELSGVL